MPADYELPDDFSVTFASAIRTEITTPRCATITTTNDEALEGDHEFTVMLGVPSPDVVNTGMPSSVSVVLTDDESKCFQ